MGSGYGGISTDQLRYVLYEITQPNKEILKLLSTADGQKLITPEG